MKKEDIRYCDAYGEQVTKETCKNCSIKRKKDVKEDFVFISDFKCEFGDDEKW